MFNGLGFYKVPVHAGAVLLLFFWVALACNFQSFAQHSTTNNNDSDLDRSTKVIAKIRLSMH
jgi:hypothetical protein